MKHWKEWLIAVLGALTAVFWAILGQRSRTAQRQAVENDRRLLDDEQRSTDLRQAQNNVRLTENQKREKEARDRAETRLQELRNDYGSDSAALKAHFDELERRLMSGDTRAVDEVLGAGCRDIIE